MTRHHHLRITPRLVEMGALDAGDVGADDEPPDAWLDAMERLARRSPDEIAEALESIEDDIANAARADLRRADQPQGAQRQDR